jgi:hypothetical protein
MDNVQQRIIHYKFFIKYFVYSCKGYIFALHF